MSENVGATRQTLQMRVSEEENKIITSKAARYGLAISEYMRLVCLHGNINKADLELLVENGYGANRINTLQMRVTSEEYLSIKNIAAKLGMHSGKYMRLFSLYAEISIDIRPPCEI